MEEYVAELSAALRGPARAKARMVGEIRDGLTDTVAALAGTGMPYRYAAQEAVREFGTPDELVSSCQRELTIAQTRRTARVVAVSVPLLIACWHLIGTSDHDPGWQQRLLAAHLAGVAAIAATLAAVTLTATGTLARWLPTPNRLPLAVAWTGTTAAVAMAVASLALAIVSALATNWPLTALAGAITAVSHAVVAASARACRECARWPLTGPAVSRPS
nr:permease prefix domain 1-containing protein [Allostreptomyces psammosilenae]